MAAAWPTYGTTTLTDCTVSGNSADYAAAACATPARLTLTDCTVSGNSVRSGRGGGGLYNHGGTLTLTNCTVSGNLGHRRRPAWPQQWHLTLTNCTVSGNSGTRCGRLGRYGSSTTTLDQHDRRRQLGERLRGRQRY